MNTKPNRDITAEILKEFRIEAYGSNYKISQQVQDAMLKALTTQREAIVKYVRDEVIGENEWEDPDIEGSDQSNGDMVVKPWRRNGLRAEQRQKLDNLLK